VSTGSWLFVIGQKCASAENEPLSDFAPLSHDSVSWEFRARRSKRAHYVLSLRLTTLFCCGAAGVRRKFNVVMFHVLAKCGRKSERRTCPSEVMQTRFIYRCASGVHAVVLKPYFYRIQFFHKFNPGETDCWQAA
jgi:hypothetical protein